VVSVQSQPGQVDLPMGDAGNMATSEKKSKFGFSGVKSSGI
jgi:hypothetical protein